MFKTIGGELYSRELAVIYYLTEDWKEEYGGGFLGAQALSFLI